MTTPSPNPILPLFFEQKFSDVPISINFEQVNNPSWRVGGEGRGGFGGGLNNDIFASLFYISKREHFQNKEKYFLFHFESSIRFWDNQSLNF